MYLSKTLYIRGLQCKKFLWLTRNDPSVLIPEDDQPWIAIGNKVGLLARHLFPAGKEVQLSSPDEQIKRTKEYINMGIKTIYEATFEFEGVMAMVDILLIDEEGLLEIYEVKSSTKVKQTHRNDLSLQYYILNGLGYKIKQSNIVCLNNKYIRKENLNIRELFKIKDSTEAVIKLQDSIPENIKSFKAIISGPRIENNVGKYCTIPYKCDAYRHCWDKIPSNSVLKISGLSMLKRLDFFTRGVTTINQIDDFSDLKQQHIIQIQSEMENSVHIDKKAVSAFLKELSYPLYHLDFESFQQAIPQWCGTSSYMNIPFQYSLHIEEEDGLLNHKEFLADEGTDPRFELAKSLVEHIPRDVTILAYNMAFEKGIIKNLAESFPQYQDQLMAIHENVRDLMPLFKNKQYYSPEMKGSFSIKYVLPALVPEMENAYKGLDLVHNGMEAMNLFPRLVHMNEEERQLNRAALLKYCELDTLAMVRILKVLRESI